MVFFFVVFKGEENLGEILQGEVLSSFTFKHGGPTVKPFIFIIEWSPQIGKVSMDSHASDR